MHRAGQLLLGEHDFAAFCRPRPGASTVRTLRHLDVSRDPSGLVVLALLADAFCHNQVRSLAGALMAVGAGRREEHWPAQVLAARRRDGAVAVAAARGLTLERVDYPPDDQVADRAATARAVRTPTAGPADSP
jgi:tRNA pseudouridine38-40 synthase